MRTNVFCQRNVKEILRDPLNLIFGAAFPLILILLLSLIQSNIPTSVFEIDDLAPGMCVFGFSFLSLFAGLLISKDRGSSFLMRLYASPMTGKEFILGYILPLLPLSVVQSVLCLLIAIPLGLDVTVNLLLGIVVLLPAAFMFIAIGLLAGSLFNEKQVGGICGALMTNLTAWLSGIWFDVSLVGGAFETIANILPFSPAVKAVQAAVSGNYGDILPNLLIVIAYAVVLSVIAIIVFSKKMTAEN